MPKKAAPRRGRSPVVNRVRSRRASSAEPPTVRLDTAATVAPPLRALSPGRRRFGFGRTGGEALRNQSGEGKAKKRFLFGKKTVKTTSIDADETREKQPVNAASSSSPVPTVLREGALLYRSAVAADNAGVLGANVDT